MKKTTTEINTKFQIGDTVHYIEETPNNGEWITCLACNGESTKDINGYRFRCMSCSGNEGRIWQNFPTKYEIKKTTISIIQIRLEENYTHIEYITEDGIYWEGTDIDDLHKTKRSAERKLKAKNNIREEP